MGDNGNKRKSASGAAPTAKRARFTMRNTGSSSTETAYPTGEINVKSFVNSHESEIKRLENAIRAAKKGINRRAFQDVPRDLRRRTASHNPQRVPKRLRSRARKEAQIDNTPLVRGKSGSGVGKGRKGWLRKEGIERSRKRWESRARKRKEKEVEVTITPMEGVVANGEASEQAATKVKPAKAKRTKPPSLSTPQTPPSRFRRRQVNKTWLPTHLWHTKRARMTPPTEPLWRFAIPLAPVVKAYRLTHRAATTQGAVAWDMSYMATVGLEADSGSIVGLLRSLHFAEEDDENPWQERGRAKKWRNGTRVWEGWLYARDSKPRRALAYVTVIWSVPDAGSKKQRAFIRVHPSAFLQLWNEIVRVSKVQKPAVVVEDLRFEMGSIEIMGPATLETLCSILSPSRSSESDLLTPAGVFASIATVTDPGVLPPGPLIAFPVCDPRLRDPPTVSQSVRDPPPEASLIDILANWPPDTTQSPPSIFSRDARLAAARMLPSQKSINRRKEVCTHGEHPEPRSTDPQIPMLLYASRKTKSWTVLLPWKCVTPVWQAMMRYPLSTGGNPRFGGLKEKRQVDYERSIASFPFDHPGTNGGWDWELQERVMRQQEWTKRPRGKRIEWTTIDLGGGRKGEIGDPWSCDWERLISSKDDTAAKTADKEAVPPPFYQFPSQAARNLVAGRSSPSEYASHSYLFTVKISMDRRGNPTNCARVYRLPRNNAELRDKWMSLRSKPEVSKGSKTLRQNQDYFNNGTFPKHVQKQRLAKSLLQPPSLHEAPPRPGEENYPIVPDEEDLIGYITTGNYNLAEGMPTAIANLALHRVFEDGQVVLGRGLGAEGRVCIVREAGHTIGRLATWEVV